MTRCAVLVALALGGCGHPADPAPEPDPIAGCDLKPLGDPTKPIDMELLAAEVNPKPPYFAGVPKPILDGGSVAMIVPPQAGWVIYVGARATNIDPCELDLKGVLKDTATGQLRVDERTINLKPRGDGWGAPIDNDPLGSDLSNVPVCPNQWASNDMYATPFELTVSLTERGGRSASKTIKVNLSCAEPQFKASCSCQCKKDYKLGQVCQ